MRRKWVTYWFPQLERMSSRWSSFLGKGLTGPELSWLSFWDSRGGMSRHFQVRSFFYHTAFQVRVPGLLLPHLPGAEGGREGREHQGDPAEAHGGPHQKVPSSQQSGWSFSFCVKSETKSYAFSSDFCHAEQISEDELQRDRKHARWACEVLPGRQNI